MAQADSMLIAQHLRGAADGIALFENLPAAPRKGNMLQTILDGVTRMEQSIVTLRGDMNAGFARIEARISAVDHNGLARLHNSTIRDSQHPLEALRTPRNTEPVGFPVTSAQLAAMTSPQLNALLAQYELPQGGNLQAKRRSFRRYIGILSDV